MYVVGIAQLANHSYGRSRAVSVLGDIQIHEAFALLEEFNFLQLSWNKKHKQCVLSIIAGPGFLQSTQA